MMRNGDFQAILKSYDYKQKGIDRILKANGIRP